MLASVVALALISSWAFDHHPLHWVNVVFVLSYLARRGVHVTLRQRAPAARS